MSRSIARERGPRFPLPFPRQALHAQALGFVHPLTGQAMRIEAPLPDDLADLIAVLRYRYRRTLIEPRD